MGLGRKGHAVAPLYGRCESYSADIFGYCTVAMHPTCLSCHSGIEPISRGAFVGLVESEMLIQ